MNKLIFKNNKIVGFNNYYKYYDGYYKSFWFGKLINKFIIKGNKLLVERIFKNVFNYSRIDNELGFNDSIFEFFIKLIVEVKPLFSSGFATIAGKKYEYPLFLSKNKRYSLAISWISHFIKQMKGKSLSDKIIYQFLELKSLRSHPIYDKKFKLLKSGLRNRHNLRYSKRRRKFKKL